MISCVLKMTSTEHDRTLSGLGQLVSRDETPEQGRRTLAPNRKNLVEYGPDIILNSAGGFQDLGATTLGSASYLILLSIYFEKTSARSAKSPPKRSTAVASNGWAGVRIP